MSMCKAAPYRAVVCLREVSFAEFAVVAVVWRKSGPSKAEGVLMCSN